MSICENCESNHDGTYGSGRFCSVKCSRGFSTKAKRKEINEKVSISLVGNIPWNKPTEKVTILEKRCKYIKCLKKFNTKKSSQKYCSQYCARKCSIWNNHNIVDWSTVHKKAYKNGNNYVAGGTTKWIKYKDIKVQGLYELRTCKILDKWLQLKKIKKWNYTNDRIEYKGIDNKIHNYLLDFKVYKNDNSFYYIETKGYEKPNDKFKWDAVRNKNIRLDVWFDDDIKKHENKIKLLGKDLSDSL